jgi:hypothetical protein
MKAAVAYLHRGLAERDKGTTKIVSGSSGKYYNSRCPEFVAGVVKARTQDSFHHLCRIKEQEVMFYFSLAEMPGVARVDHRTKCVSLVAISVSQNFETHNCWPT